MNLTDSYTQRLVLALQKRCVPADRIGEIVAEIDSHVAESGEDPVEAFGTPQEYADAVADARSAGSQSPRRRAAAVLAALAGAATGWLIATTVIALAAGERTVYGAPAWVAVLTCVALAGVTAWLAGRQRRAVHDPRTQRRITPSGAVAFTAVVVALTGLVLLVSLAV